MTIEDLVVSHADWIISKARRYYPDNKNDADDLASETICKCLSQSKRFDRERDFKPWALTIMHNTFITAYNRRKCVMMRALEDTDIVLSYEHTDQRASVRRIFSVIRECWRKSVNIECVLLYAEGYDYYEIANKVGIPYGTVKSRIANGRRSLKEHLESW